MLAEVTGSLLQRFSKQREVAADTLLKEVNKVAAFLARAIKDSAKSDSELLLALHTELTTSSLLEHWARLVLTLAGCEGCEDSNSAQVAASRFSTAWAFISTLLNPDCARSLLASSPCFSYLLTSQLVALCATLDGGTAYGMPEAPGFVLWKAALSRLPPMHGTMVVPAADVVGFARIAFAAAVPCPLEHQMPQGGEGAEPTSSPDGLVSPDVNDATPSAAAPIATEASVAAAEASAGSFAAGGNPGPAGAVADIAELHAGAASRQVPAPAVAAEGHELGREQEPGRGPAAPRLDRRRVPPAASWARVRTAAPQQPLLNPSVCLEISLRLADALCRLSAPNDADPQQACPAATCAQGGAGAGAGSCARTSQPRQLRLVDPPSRVTAVVTAVDALDVARQLIQRAATAGARPAPGQEGEDEDEDEDGCSASSAETTCAPKGPGPLERWWKSAVAMGRVLAEIAAAARADTECLGRVAGVLEEYLRLVDQMTAAESEGPPATPSKSTASALSAGFLPCLERLLRAVLPLRLFCGWGWRLGSGYEAAWSRMLAFADKDQLEAVIDAAVEGLRRAAAACRAVASPPRAGSGAAAAAAAAASNVNDSADVDAVAWQVLNAACTATTLASLDVLPCLADLATGLEALLSVPEFRASCGPAVSRLARLGESLTLIATRLLPELSAVLLGGVLPLYNRCSDAISDFTVRFLLCRQLHWACTLAAALAAESTPAATAAVAASAAGGAGGGGTRGSDGGDGGCSAGDVVSGSGGGVSSGPRVHRWRQLLLVELRLPGLLGTALGLALDCGAEHADECMSSMCDVLCMALWLLAVLVPAELSRIVAAAGRAEAAAAGRAGAGRGPAPAGRAPPLPLLPPPPSSSLLRRVLGPGGPLERAELLAAVEAACGGGTGAVAGLSCAGGGSGGLPGGAEPWLRGARLLSLREWD